MSDTDTIKTVRRWVDRVQKGKEDEIDLRSLRRVCHLAERHLERGATPSETVHGIPEGWRLVPEEPTLSMCEAAYDWIDEGSAIGAYKAMIVAAPQLPSLTCPHGVIGYCEPCALVDPGEEK